MLLTRSIIEKAFKYSQCMIPFCKKMVVGLYSLSRELNIRTWTFSVSESIIVGIQIYFQSDTFISLSCSILHLSSCYSLILFICDSSEISINIAPPVSFAVTCAKCKAKEPQHRRTGGCCARDPDTNPWPRWATGGL